MKPIGVAMWGLQHQHAPWYGELLAGLPEFALRCVCEEDGGVLAARGAAMAVPCFRRPEEVLARADVELVLVFVPHRQMPEAALKVLAAGKHCLVEKPMGTSSAEVRRICQAARSAGTAVTTGFYFRYHPAAAKIRRWIADGLLGRVTHLEGRMVCGGAARYAPDQAWILHSEERGGPAFNYGVHWADLFPFLTGLEARSVTAMTGSFGGGPARTIEDEACAVLEMTGGVLAVLDLSYGLPEGHPRHRDFFIGIRGTLGCVEWNVGYGPEDDEVLRISRSPAGGAAATQVVRVPVPTAPGYGGVMGRNFMLDLAGAIRAGRPAPVTAEDGLRAIAVAEAILRSSAEGRKVDLPSGPETA